MNKFMRCLAICLMIALSLGFSCRNHAIALSPNSYMSDFESNEFLSVDYDTLSEQNIPIVNTVGTPQQKSFVHKYSSQYMYSTATFQLLIEDYETPSPFSFLCSYIVFSSDDHYHNINSVSFEINGKTYTFSDLFSKNQLYNVHKSYAQTIAIYLGYAGFDFIEAMANLVTSTTTFEELEAIIIPVTFYGDEKISTYFDYRFCLDFYTLYFEWLNHGAAESIKRVHGSMLTVQ